MNNRKIIFILLNLVLISLVYPNIALAKNPKYTDWIRYRYPAWLSNEKIVFVKSIEHIKHNYDWLSSVAKAMDVLTKQEIQICSMNIDGSGEKVIKNIIINYTLPGRTMHWEDKTFEGVMVINCISANYKKQLIAFSVDCFDKRAIFLMDFYGTDVRKIADEGYELKFSPDETKILYSTTRSYVNPKYEGIKKDSRSEEWRKVSNLKDYNINETTLWLMDINGSNREKIISDDDIYAFAWHPDSKRIFYVNRREKRKNIINLSDKSKEGFNLFSDEQSGDGAKIVVVGNAIYYDPNSLFLKLKNIPSGAQLSPDGTKLVGGPMGDIKADICVVNTDGTGLKGLRMDSKADY